MFLINCISIDRKMISKGLPSRVRCNRHHRRHICLIYQLMLMNECMEGSVRSFEVEVPALRLARLKKMLRDLQFNKDFSVNATLLAQHFGKSNQDYEKANKDYHQELCTRHGCEMERLIKEGTRGRHTKGAEAGSNARRYCKEIALHFAQ